MYDFRFNLENADQFKEYIGSLRVHSNALVRAASNHFNGKGDSNKLEWPIYTPEEKATIDKALEIAAKVKAEQNGQSKRRDSPSIVLSDWPATCELFSFRRGLASGWPLIRAACGRWGRSDVSRRQRCGPK